VKRAIGNQHPYRDHGIANSDVIKGWRFGATLQLRTPLFALQHHGELVLGVDKELPEYGPSWAGMWEPVVRTWDELGIKGPRLAAGSRASEIGQVTEDGGSFLKFLLKYRTAIESNEPVVERLARVRELFAAPEFADVTSSLRAHAADRWAVAELSNDLGIRFGVAAVLFEHGLQDAKAVRSATDELLLGIPGIGKKMLASIRGSEGDPWQ
jgi:hypothetical protein